MTRTSYKVYETGYPYLVTCSVVRWLPIFRNQDIAKVVLESLVFHQKKRDLTLYAYVIMDDHIHLVMQSDKLKNNMRTFKSFTARQIIDLFKNQKKQHYLHKLREAKLCHHKDSEFQCWQEGYHPKKIIGDKMMIQKIQYIHDNPVKAEFVDKPEAWSYSSASDYHGGEGPIPITKFTK